jgi:hypothetical protein
MSLEGHIYTHTLDGFEKKKPHSKGKDFKVKEEKVKDF